MNGKRAGLEYSLGELETGYRRQYLNQDIRQAFLFGSTWMALNLLFILTDWLLYKEPQVFLTAVKLRFSLFATTMAGLYFLKRVHSPTAYDRLVFLLVSSALVHVFLLNHNLTNSIYAGLDYLIVLGIYLLVPNRLLYHLIACGSFSVVSMVAYLFFVPITSVPQLIVTIASFLVANWLGLWASIRFHAHRRQQYEAQTRSQELRKDLIQNALVDQLTGVSNRRHFFQAAEAEFERFSRYNRSFSLLMIDLDHFKQVNDQYGHPVGDKVLKELAETIVRNKRDNDIFGRLGGEEFALLLPETPLAGATEIAVRLRRCCHILCVPGNMALRITVSIGVTQVRASDSSFDEVLARADEMLYRAKNNGRDRVEVA